MKIDDEQLSAYLDNALPPEDRAQVDRALSESPDLQNALARLNQIKGLLKELPTPEPSEKFYRTVLEKTDRSHRPRLQWTLPLVGAATAGLIMVFIAKEKKPEDPFPTYAFVSNSPKTEGASRSMDKTMGAASMGLPKTEFLARKMDARKNLLPENDPQASSNRTKFSSLVTKKPAEPDLAQEWMGDFSGVNEERKVVIKDSTSWANLWAEHQSYRGSPSPVPDVDSTEFMVVGIFLGDRGSSGYGVHITAINDMGKELLVTYKDIHPYGKKSYLGVMTQPTHLKVIPRTDHPVRFKKE